MALSDDIDLIGLDLDTPGAVALSKELSCGNAHSPEPRSESCRPGTPAGSIWKARQNDALAAITRRSAARNSNGSLDAAMTASVLAASTWKGSRTS